MGPGQQLIEPLCGLALIICADRQGQHGQAKGGNTGTQQGLHQGYLVSYGWGRDDFALVGMVCRGYDTRSEEHTSELQSRPHLVCRLLLEKKKKDCTQI